LDLSVYIDKTVFLWYDAMFWNGSEHLKTNLNSGLSGNEKNLYKVREGPLEEIVKHIIAVAAIACLALIASACAAGYPNYRPAYYHDGMGAQPRTVVTRQEPVRGVTHPPTSAEYSNPMSGTADPHADYYGTVVTYGILSNAQGRYGTADPAFEKRVAHVEMKAENLRRGYLKLNQNDKIMTGFMGSALVLNRKNCAYLVKHPETLSINGDDALTKRFRAGIVAKCHSILGR